MEGVLIRLLGPLSVTGADGRTVDLGGARLRVLLTALALEAGRPVSAARLIDTLWPDEQPANPGNALQALVSRPPPRPADACPAPGRAHRRGPHRLRGGPLAARGRPRHGPLPAAAPGPPGDPHRGPPTAPPSSPQAAPHPAAGHRLPAPLTSFLGREAELAALHAELASTRLALEAAAGSGARQVELVELAQASSPAEVPATVLTARLLADCPGLRVLATSREPLGITGEQLHPVPPLALPLEQSDGERRLTPDQALEFSAVRLFADRAAAVRPGYTPDAEGLPAVLRICRALDGQPLAIELAAARMRSLSPEQIDQRLTRRFHLLTGGSRTVLPRHRTLRAVVDWSWELLEKPERTLLARMSVFAGGAVLDVLSSLVDKSAGSRRRSASRPRPRTGR